MDTSLLQTMDKERAPNRLQNSLQEWTGIETAGEIIVKFQQFVTYMESPLVFGSVDFAPSWVDSDVSA